MILLAQFVALALVLRGLVQLLRTRHPFRTHFDGFLAALAGPEGGAFGGNFIKEVLTILTVWTTLLLIVRLWMKVLVD
jgi:uncharacterized membrane protein YoaK (UPF0700 family)